ncbi:MAG: hypothetical protein GX810_02475 [Clostridiales bacterium]|nr:hypothetical protein [Clostridiales bacterium]
MGLYLSIDGGGSKCIALLFDEGFTLLGTGLSGGVNTTQNSPDSAGQHMAECLDQALQGHTDRALDLTYLNLVGDRVVMERLLRERIAVREVHHFSEPQAALLAGLLREEGMIAHAGTGSDAFWVGEIAPRDIPHGRGGVVGAWGPILGDQGSGAWIGQQALLRIVRAVDGWGPQTAMTDMVMTEWALTAPYEMVPKVYRHPAPFRLAASLTRVVGRAADLGDGVALSILREAGEMMAEQIACLVRRLPELETQTEVLCAGGAWKTHASMYAAFGAHLQQLGVTAQPVKPAFDAVAAGPVHRALAQGMTPDEARKRVAQAFPLCVSTW